MQADKPQLKPEVFTVHYVLKNRVGELVDTSEGSEPLHFLYGTPEIIAGIQEAVKDRRVGDCLEVTIPPEMAYGDYREDLVRKVPRSLFEGVENLQVGMKFQTNSGDQAQVVQVVSIDGNLVKVDANHARSEEHTSELQSRPQLVCRLL